MRPHKVHQRVYQGVVGRMDTRATLSSLPRTHGATLAMGPRNALLEWAGPREVYLEPSAPHFLRAGPSPRPCETRLLGKTYATLSSI